MCVYTNYSACPQQSYLGEKTGHINGRKMMRGINKSTDQIYGCHELEKRIHSQMTNLGSKENLTGYNERSNQ